MEGRSPPATWAGAYLRDGDLGAARLLDEALRRFETMNAASFVADTLVRPAECADRWRRRPGDGPHRASRPTPAVRDRRIRRGQCGACASALAAADVALEWARQAGVAFEQAQSLEVRARARRSLVAAAYEADVASVSLYAGLGVGATPPDLTAVS